MSRRRGEFEHRTSIFEGAFRAWSHLGGMDPDDLESKPATELDPLSCEIENDPRLSEFDKKGKRREIAKNPDGSKRREYAYEPLPRAGLSHPYVQAILSPWLGPEADTDAIQLGLTTLRTWWQHRRKGESGSAVAALGTDKMKGVVEGYTRHFFNLAHCLIVNDKEQAPRTLQTKMKDREKQLKKKRLRQDDRQRHMGLQMQNMNPEDPAAAALAAANRFQNDLPSSNDNMSPLEQLHLAQQMKLRDNGGVQATQVNNFQVQTQNPAATMPIVDMKGKCIPGKIDLPEVVNKVNHAATQLSHRGNAAGIKQEYGNPSTYPIVFVSQNGDIQIAMTVDGITCAHCVKIVETVLKGCNGNKSPIDGLLDAAADRALSKILIKIDQSGNAKKIAFEAARNLSMVGYTAKPLEMNIVDPNGDKKSTMDVGKLVTAFEVVANTSPLEVFDWSAPCTCPDNGILRTDCARHSQMNMKIFEAFMNRQQSVQNYMAGVSKGAPALGQEDNTPIPLDTVIETTVSAPTERHEMATRNPSIISFGGLGSLSGRMSFTSNATFGRAMSGLSALSIDWENMEDFDVNIDHSAHINNDRVGSTVGGVPSNPSPLPYTQRQGPGGRRSSLRRSIAGPPGEGNSGNAGMQVSFKV